MLTEEQGIKAIIALQDTVGIVEPEARAKKEWGRFSENQKKTTESAHKVICGGFPDDDAE